jgi:hypothetical protein
VDVNKITIFSVKFRFFVQYLGMLTITAFWPKLESKRKTVFFQKTSFSKNTVFHVIYPPVSKNLKLKNCSLTVDLDLVGGLVVG